MLISHGSIPRGPNGEAIDRLRMDAAQAKKHKCPTVGDMSGNKVGEAQVSNTHEVGGSVVWFSHPSAKNIWVSQSDLSLQDLSWLWAKALSALSSNTVA